MQQVQLITVKDRMAKYRIRRDETHNGQPATMTYYAYFMRDENGIWLMDRF